MEGNTVGEALGKITSQFPDLKKQLYGDGGKLRSFVNIYVNDEDVRYLQKDETPLKENDELRIIPSIAGGSATLTRRGDVSIRPRSCVTAGT